MGALRVLSLSDDPGVGGVRGASRDVNVHFLRTSSLCAGIERAKLY